MKSSFSLSNQNFFPRCSRQIHAKIQIFALLEHHKLYHDIYYFSTCFLTYAVFCDARTSFSSILFILSFILDTYAYFFILLCHIFFISSKILNIVVYPTALFSIIFRICNTAIPSECI